MSHSRWKAMHSSLAPARSLWTHSRSVPRARLRWDWCAARGANTSDSAASRPAATVDEGGEHASRSGRSDTNLARISSAYGLVHASLLVQVQNTPQAKPHTGQYR